MHLLTTHNNYKYHKTKITGDYLYLYRFFSFAPGLFLLNICHNLLFHFFVYTQFLGTDLTRKISQVCPVTHLSSQYIFYNPVLCISRCHFFSCGLQKWTLISVRSLWPWHIESQGLLLFTFLGQVQLIYLTCCVLVWFRSIIIICFANCWSTSCVHSHSDSHTW